MSLPSTLEPMGIPKHSPIWTRTEGAGAMTTCLVGSLRAFQTFSVSSRSVRAPVGHTWMHWPQFTQLVSARGISKGLETWVL